MLGKLLTSVALILAFGNALAAVDVNFADEAALRGIKGIGPAKAKAIIDERAARGPFKDATDLSRRVKGLGSQTVGRLQQEGLAIGDTPLGHAAPVATVSPRRNEVSVMVRK